MCEMLQWHDAFSVGHPALDAEHRRMLEMINNVCAYDGAESAADSVRGILADLERLASEHFAHEESVLGSILNATTIPTLRKTITDMVDNHHEEHQIRLSVLRKMISIVDRKPDERRSTLCYNLTHWFIVHAIRYDAQVKTVIQSA